MDTAAVGDVVMLFVLMAFVFEQALSVLFNWRVFKDRLGSKGFKTPISVVLAFAVFWSYDLDIIAALLVALGNDAAISTGGQVLTAFLIAGGSSGFYEILKKLGIRAPTLAKVESKTENSS